MKFKYLRMTAFLICSLSVFKLVGGHSINSPDSLFFMFLDPILFMCGILVIGVVVWKCENLNKQAVTLGLKEKHIAVGAKVLSYESKLWYFFAPVVVIIILGSISLFYFGITLLKVAYFFVYTSSCVFAYAMSNSYISKWEYLEMKLEESET